MMELIKSAEFLEIGKLLLDCEQTVASAESVTSGAIQLALSGIPEASRFFQGGITAYNVAQKYKHLQVEPTHAIEVNCVSERVARQMARSVCELFRSDWGIGITGYASPKPESDGKLFAFYSVVFQNQCILEERLESPEQEPADAQIWFANQVCERFARLLKEPGSTPVTASATP